jgi:putative transposase
MHCVHAAGRSRYGRPRVVAALPAAGRWGGRNRIARRTTDSNHAFPFAPNLLGHPFSAVAPNFVWLADIIDIPTREGSLYLAVVLDLFSRKVVGWAMRETITQDPTLDALRMVIANRRPGPGLLHHVARGCRYAARAYRRRLEPQGMLCSMSLKGDC